MPIYGERRRFQTLVTVATSRNAGKKKGRPEAALKLGEL
jgi:hypothetical protein